MKKNILLLLLPLILVTICGGRASAARPRSLADALDTLDHSLTRRPDIYRSRHHRIDSLSSIYRHHPHHRHARHVADAYQGLNIDSAVSYYQIAAALANASRDTVAMHEALVEYAGQLGKAGHFTEAIATLDTINPDVMSRLDKLRYYDLRSQIYIDGLNSVRFKDRRHQLTASAVANLDSLRMLLPPRTIGRRMTDAMRLNLCGDSLLAEGEIKEFFDSIPVSHPLHGIAAGILAGFYRGRPEKADEYLYYLALAASSDALNAGGEAYTLEQLGSEMLKRGDFERAYNYLTVAGEAIHELGTRKRFTYDAPPLAILLDSMHRRDRTRHISFIVTLCLLGVVIVTFIVTMIRVSRRTTAQAVDTRRYRAIAAAKDKYITQLLELCSSLYDSMEDFNRLVGRKIMANQTRDLYQDVESGKILRRQTEKFYTVFDRSVFNVYPDFVDEINALLQPDKRITLSEPGVLTPELRIVAFLRFGITDSNRISKFLGLSLNTVYTYRNRMKGRAIRRDSFESDVLKMDGFA